MCTLPLNPLLFCRTFDDLLLSSCSLNRKTPSPPPFANTSLYHFCKNPLSPREQRSPHLFSRTNPFSTLTPPSTHNSLSSTICTHHSLHQHLVRSPQKTKTSPPTPLRLLSPTSHAQLTATSTPSLHLFNYASPEEQQGKSAGSGSPQPVAPSPAWKAEITALDDLRKSNIISGWRESEGIKSEEE